MYSISPLDGRYLDDVRTLGEYFSEFALNKYRVLVEIKWLKFISKHLKLNINTTELDTVYENFSENSVEEIKFIEKSTKHDVKAVEYYLRMFHNSEFIHFCCTSEDINNVAYSLMLAKSRENIILPIMKHLIDAMKIFNIPQPMLSRTHGQPASPTTVGKEFSNFIFRLQRQKRQLSDSKILAKFNGAVGNFNAHVVAYPDMDWKSLSQCFIESFGLEYNPCTTQIESHDSMVEFFDILHRFNTILIGFNRDIWGYISLGYFKQKVSEKEIGSSTMPHKVNPINFENSEGNLGIANAFLKHFSEKLPISRFQRDLSDSTVLRNIGVALGHCILAYKMCILGLLKLEINPEVMNRDLDESWEILSEPIQILMKKYSIPNSYEKLKDFSRGKKLTKEVLHQFIETIPVPEECKKQMLELTPHNYLGYSNS